MNTRRRATMNLKTEIKAEDIVDGMLAAAICFALFTLSLML